jgi:hypothetical protein
MTSSLVSAALLAIALCATPLLAQEATSAESPSTPPAEPAASPQTEPAASPTSDQAAPGVRIVRLSQVNGEVQLDRQTGRGFEAAFANLPIAQGGRLRTGDGVAEVEFEDNSSLRLTPRSLVEFPVLSLRAPSTSASPRASRATSTSPSAARRSPSAPPPTSHSPSAASSLGWMCWMAPCRR